MQKTAILNMDAGRRLSRLIEIIMRIILSRSVWKKFVLIESPVIKSSAESGINR